MPPLPAPSPDFCSGRLPHTQDSVCTISLHSLWLPSPPPTPSPCCCQSGPLLPGLPGSILAFLMLIEVSTPGRKLKPPSSIKGGSSCPCTVTLAPVTVDSSGMKSFCSVRSVRVRPGSGEGAEERVGLGEALGNGHAPSHPTQSLTFQGE